MLVCQEPFWDRISVFIAFMICEIRLIMMSWLNGIHQVFLMSSLCLKSIWAFVCLFVFNRSWNIEYCMEGYVILLSSWFVFLEEDMVPVNAEVFFNWIARLLMSWMDCATLMLFIYLLSAKGCLISNFMAMKSNIIHCAVSLWDFDMYCCLLPNLEFRRFESLITKEYLKAINNGPRCLHLDIHLTELLSWT